MLPSMPQQLMQRTQGYTWTRVTVGFSGAAMFLLSRGPHKLYLKTQRKPAKESLIRERDVMRWLHGKLPVPEVLYNGEDEKNEYLLVTAIPGEDASSRSYESMLPALMEQLGLGLKVVHELPAAGCPFDQRLDVKLAEAARRAAEGLVDEQNFDERRVGAKASDLLEELLRLRPIEEDLVFTHGDYCLPNIILRDGKVSGFVDWGRGGVADRYQDVALAVRSIIYNFGEEHVATFLQAYGLSRPDPAKIHYYQLLDEFF